MFRKAEGGPAVGTPAGASRADNRFSPGSEYLADVISARWWSIPGFGPKESGLCVLVKFAVRNLIESGRVGEPIGREARTYIPVGEELSATTAEGGRFLAMLGVEPSLPSEFARRADLAVAHRAFTCVFGDPDPVAGYQSLRAAERADPRLIAGMGRMEAARPRPVVLPFGLELPRPNVAELGGVEATFDHAPMGWVILRRLAERHPERYEAGDLARDCWRDARRARPEDPTASLQTEVSKLRKIIETLGLAIPARGARRAISSRLSRIERADQTGSRKSGRRCASPEPKGRWRCPQSQTEQVPC